MHVKQARVRSITFPSRQHSNKGIPYKAMPGVMPVLRQRNGLPSVALDPVTNLLDFLLISQYFFSELAVRAVLR
jgi:hypothetical protein